LVLWGKHDKLVPPLYAQEFASRISGARVEMIEHAGHVLTAEHPARIAGMVEEFLA
jgi:pimeloyl-ACP methyl ester carboxylesterase